MEWLHALIGDDTGPINWWQMALRAAIIFLYLLALARLGGRRAFGNWTPFDIVLGILLGSTLSRTLTANAPFVPTLVAGAVLVGMHVLLAYLALYCRPIAFLAKGREVRLMEQGTLIHRNLRRCGVSEQDLRERLRTAMNTEDLDEVANAYLERGGDVSFIRR